MRRAVPLLLGLALALAVPEIAHALPLTREGYVRLLQDYADATQNPRTVAELRNLQRRMVDLPGVRLGDGTLVTPDLSEEREQLEAMIQRRKANPAAPFPVREQQRARLLVRLFQATLRTAPPTSDPGVAAREILAGAEYRQEQKTIPETVIQRTWKRFLKNLSKWLDKLFSSRSTPNLPDGTALAATVRILLYVLAGIAALIALYFAIRYAQGWRPGRRKPKASPLDDLTGDGIADPLGASQEAAARGDLRLAVRLAYIALLRQLHDRGLLTLAKNRTNGEYQRQLVQRAPQEAPRVLPATRRFDEVWYGGFPATEQDLVALRQLHDHFRGPNP